MLITTSVRRPRNRKPHLPFVDLDQLSPPALSAIALRSLALAVFFLVLAPILAGQQEAPDGWQLLSAPGAKQISFVSGPDYALWAKERRGVLRRVNFSSTSSARFKNGLITRRTRLSALARSFPAATENQDHDLVLGVDHVGRQVLIEVGLTRNPAAEEELREAMRWVATADAMPRRQALILDGRLYLLRADGRVERWHDFDLDGRHETLDRDFSLPLAAGSNGLELHRALQGHEAREQALRRGSAEESAKQDLRAEPILRYREGLSEAAIATHVQKALDSGLFVSGRGSDKAQVLFLDLAELVGLRIESSLPLSRLRVRRFAGFIDLDVDLDLELGGQLQPSAPGRQPLVRKSLQTHSYRVDLPIQLRLEKSLRVVPLDELGRPLTASRRINLRTVPIDMLSSSGL